MMIGASIVIAVIFFVLFVKSVKSGQYDDMHTPAIRMLFEDDMVKTTSKTKKSINQNQ